MLRPKPIEVKPLENYLLLISFSNGEDKIFDVKPMLSGSWFGELPLHVVLKALVKRIHMKQKIITEVLQEMQRYLNNAEMQLLKSIPESNFAGIDIVENMPLCLIDAAEGCSEKSLKFKKLLWKCNKVFIPLTLCNTHQICKSANPQLLQSMTSRATAL